MMPDSGRTVTLGFPGFHGGRRGDGATRRVRLHFTRPAWECLRAMGTDVDLPWGVIGACAGAVGFLVALLVTPVVRAVARATDVVDHPGDRHIHDHS